jgi:hypothetical protein
VAEAGIAKIGFFSLLVLSLALPVSHEPHLNRLRARTLNSIDYERLNCVFGFGTLEAL